MRMLVSPGHLWVVVGEAFFFVLFFFPFFLDSFVGIGLAKEGIWAGDAVFLDFGEGGMRKSMRSLNGASEGGGAGVQMDTDSGG